MTQTHEEKTPVQKQAPFGFRVLSGDDILTLPKPVWRVAGVLPESGIAVIYGPSKIGKSFLVLSLALAIAQGDEWFGWQTTRCPVLYVNLESNWGLQNRLRAWMRETGHHLPDNLHFILEQFDLQTSAHLTAIIQAARTHACKVVIIDTFNRATLGIDENSSKNMGEVVKAATSIQQSIDGLVLFVAHTGKDDERGLRGHSLFFAALDAALKVGRDKTGRFLELDKVKEAEDGTICYFEIPSVVIIDQDGEPATSCIVVPIGTPQQKRDSSPLSLSKCQRYGLESFDLACKVAGVDNLHEEVWRQCFYAAYPVDSKDNSTPTGIQDSKKKAFQRATTELVKLGILSAEGKIYSRDTDPGQINGTGRDTPL